MNDVIRLDPDQVRDLSKSIAAFPKIALDLLQLLDEEEVNLHYLTDRAKQDPVISSRLIGLANSVGLKSSNREFDDLYSAISRLGLGRVRFLVLSASIHDSFKSLSGARAAALWSHSIDVGICAQVLAEHFGQRSELSYLCGLVHDVGRLWLSYNFPAAYETVCATVLRRGDLGEIAAEREIFGMDHAQIGEVLAEMWSLPAAIRQAILHHHGHPAMPADPLVVLVHFAEVICQALHPDGMPISHLSPLIDQVLAPDWSRMPLLYGEMEARARLARADVHSLVD